jgi:hypothetical protein
MPFSLQYPVERSRDLRQRWERLMLPGRAAVEARAEEEHWPSLVVLPPRDPNDDDPDDDEEEDEADEDREPGGHPRT